MPVIRYLEARIKAKLKDSCVSERPAQCRKGGLLPRGERFTHVMAALQQPGRSTLTTDVHHLQEGLSQVEVANTNRDKRIVCGMREKSGCGEARLWLETARVPCDVRPNRRV
jgi:hypothetical protein